MVDDLVFSIGCMTFLLFYVADFYMAYLLNQLKRAHPAIEECSPQGRKSFESPEEIGDETTRVELGHGMDETDDEGASIRPRWTAPFGFSVSSVANASKEQVLERLVLLASAVGPFVCFLQVVSWRLMQWSLFGVPSWLSYLTILPGMGLAVFYAMRVYRVSKCHEVTKGQWLATMWFRLDVTCLMATVMLLGWGDWFVALCLYVVDLYLAQRLLVTERRLVNAAGGTQLLNRT
jgi:hypothetical protein